MKGFSIRYKQTIFQIFSPFLIHQYVESISLIPRKNLFQSLYLASIAVTLSNIVILLHLWLAEFAELLMRVRVSTWRCCTRKKVIRSFLKCQNCRNRGDILKQRGYYSFLLNWQMMISILYALFAMIYIITLTVFTIVLLIVWLCLSIELLNNACIVKMKL